MPRAPRRLLFFDSTRSAFRQIEEGHDLFWCAAVSLWNTRAQLAGWRAVAPDMSQEDLDARFSAGLDMSGSNVVTFMDARSWDEQVEEIARLRLMMLFSHVEGWLAAMALTLQVPAKQRRSWAAAMLLPKKYPAALAGLGTSAAMTDLYLASARHLYDLDAGITDAVLALRYFKELRNAIVHSGGRASAAVIQTQKDYEQSIATAPLWTHYQPPRYVPAQIGDEIEVDHHGVVGLTGLVQRCIVTFELAFLRTPAGEDAYLKRWKELFHKRGSLPADAGRRGRALASMQAKIGGPFPLTPVPSLEALLVKARLIAF